MFKNKNNESKNSQSTPSVPSGATNTLTKGTSLEGTLRADHDIRIDGHLNGKLYCKGRVIIGQEGSIEGEISCTNAIIEGRFNGNLKVSEILSVKESAHIDGDIQTGKLNIQPGAIFNGNCSMGGQKLKSISGDDSKNKAV